MEFLKIDIKLIVWEVPPDIVCSEIPNIEPTNVRMKDVTALDKNGRVIAKRNLWSFATSSILRSINPDDHFELMIKILENNRREIFDFSKKNPMYVECDFHVEGESNRLGIDLPKKLIRLIADLSLELSVDFID